MGTRTAMHWTHHRQAPIVRGTEDAMRANDVRSTDILRHGAYVCVRVREDARRTVADVGVPALAARLGLMNEFAPADGHPPQAIAFLRRVGATPGLRVEDDLLGADAVIHVASQTAEPV